MSTTLGHSPDARHPLLPDIGRPVMAKAAVRSPDVDWMTKLGAAIQDAVKAVRWSNKEAAGKVDVDDAEFGKWLSGTRRPHFDRLFNVQELRVPLILALAALGGEGVEITTAITIRQVA